MLRLVILCLVLTLANSRIALRRNYAQRDPLDDWRHLEANEIPGKAADGNDSIPSEILFENISPAIPVELTEDQPSYATGVYDFTDPPEEIFDATGGVEAAENSTSTLPDYTEITDGYHLFPGVGRIKLFYEDLSWSVAQRVCQSEGADLAVPDSQQKVAAFKKLFELYPMVPARAILRQQVYIGIRAPRRTREFVTVKGDHVSPDFQLWAKGEPDNQPPGDEDCVTFRSDGRIRDIPCHFNLPFFCERSL